MPVMAAKSSRPQYPRCIADKPLSRLLLMEIEWPELEVMELGKSAEPARDTEQVSI
jgi:hypothetical protein